MEEIQAWFTGRLPDEWFTGPVEVTGDRDEVFVIGELADVELEEDVSDEARSAARSARVDRFRGETRRARMKIAQEAQRKFGRKVSWGVTIAGEKYLFTHLAIPVMTRLRLKERQVLDTLIDAGVARSRSEALAWCVALVAKNESEWIDKLRDALVAVEEARATGPTAA
ncbi:MAG TPA: hypothetical protein VNC78_12810 [Actinomycetota bacterium]|nr:hypothetical protein [Actinomycetota bacterium]